MGLGKSGFEERAPAVNRDTPSRSVVGHRHGSVLCVWSSVEISDREWDGAASMLALAKRQHKLLNPVHSDANDRLVRWRMNGLIDRLLDLLTD